MLPSHAVDRPVPATTGEVRAHAGRGERGAVLVHTAVAMAGLLAFSALTIDLGSMWVVRAQAQNAADAAALAGTVSLAYVDPTDTDAARAAAQAIVQAHSVWGQAIPSTATQITVGACPSGSPAVAGACVNVTVGRGADYGTPMPTFFAGLVGGSSSNIRASASGKVFPGNVSSCLRPLAIMDSWNDSTGGWQFDDLFEPPDSYVPPSPSGPGSGHTYASARGVRVRLPRGVVHRAPPTPAAGNHYFNLDVSRVGSPAGSGDDEVHRQRYMANMASCSGIPVGIGDTLGYFDADHDATIFSAETLINADPNAYWDGSGIRGSDPRFGGASPRLLTIALVDPYHYSMQPRPPSGPNSLQYRIRNMIGFFLERTEGSDYALVGVLLANSGTFSPAGDTVAPESSFLQTVALVR